MERNVDVSKPSTSSSKPNLVQPLQNKSSVNNLMKDKHNCGNLNTSPKKGSSKFKRSQIDDASINNPSKVNDISIQCQNLNLNTENNSVEQAANMKSMPTKNNQEKDSLQQLKIPQPGAQPDVLLGGPSVGQHANAATNYIQNTAPNNYGNIVYYLFTSQIGPLYTPVNSRCLDNITSTNLLQKPNLPRANIVQCFQQNMLNFQLPQQNVPRHLQNIMHHPLLCNILPVQNNVSTTARAQTCSKKTNRPKKSDKNYEVYSFEPYITAKEVENGLKTNQLLEGVLRINPKQHQHSYLSSNNRSEQDVLIDGIGNRNRAMEGDVVIVKLLSNDEPNDDKQQRRGKVVYIKEKVHSRTCIGVLKLMPDKNRQVAYFVPRDYRVPRLNIPCTSWPMDFYKKFQTYENTLFLAKMLDWYDTRFALGTIECHIGISGDLQSEARAILVQNQLDVSPFAPELRNLYPRLDYKIPSEEINLREDCRKLCIFSIDPHSCRDIDDAVSCRKLKNGNYEVGVHISDVSHFLTENTKLDEKVAEKGTTIYMVDRAYHMLPDDLCMLCSLFPAVDKLAFSVFWEITEDAKVLQHRFAKTVIHSCCKLSYENAQAILDDAEKCKDDFPEIFNGFVFDDIYKSIKILGKISSIFRKNRFDGGALRIDQPKINFSLNSFCLPESFNIYVSKESHQLIEEFMLLTNITVANRIFEDYPRIAFLRCHPPPSTFMLRELASSLAPLDIDLDYSSAGALHRSILPYTNPEAPDTGKAMVLSMLCSKPMTRAKYFCSGCQDDEDFPHYALNVPIYTHFTSPIRRYADIMVHRLLAASLKYRENPTWTEDHVQSIAAHCNKQKYNAKKAGEMSTEFYTLKYIELNSPVVTEAVVVDVREKYIDVIIVSMSLNRRIFFNNDFPGDFLCIKNEAGTRLSKMELTWRSKDNLPEIQQSIEVFTIINVEMYKTDDMIKVETKIVKPQ